MEQDLNFSKKESARFKMNIYRGYFNALQRDNITKIKKSILNNDVDTAIFRIPTEELQYISKLDNIGFPYIVADTLVYYYVDFKKSTIHNIKNENLEFVRINESDIELLNLLVDDIFVEYNNHYSSNPYFSTDNIIEGYKEWARGLIDENEGKIGWFVKKNNENIGFATCSYDSNENISEGVLYGVKPSASGGGIYSDIIRFTQKYFEKLNITQMKVSTQIQNYAVQKVWSREGFVLKQSFNTIHINSLLNMSKIPKKEMDICITKKEIEDYGRVSGDINDIHFNDNYAKSLGLNGRIAHGLISNAILSKYYGTTYPGKGTFFLSYKYIFYKPIYPDVTYKVIISFPYYNPNNNRYLSIAKIIDSDSNLCLISYNELIKK